MDFTALAELLALGALLGALGGLLGIGGGLFAIPILGVVFGLDQQHAQGTSLVMVVPNVAVGLYSYAKRGGMDRRLGLTLAIAALPCTIVGAHFATHVSSASLRVAFAVFALIVGCYSLLRVLAGPTAAESATRPATWQTGLGIGAVGGAVSGAFGVGGAIFAVPLLSALFGFSQAVAQGYGLALVAPGTFAGIAAYGVAGDVDWMRGIALAAGSIFTVPYGVRFAHRMPDRALRMTFVVLTFASGAALLLRG